MIPAAKLRLAQSAGRALLDGLPEAALITDADHVIRWANQAAATLTGRTIGELRGRRLSVLFTTGELERIRRARELDHIDLLTRFHCTLSTKSGELREVSVAVGRLADRARDLRVYLLRDLGRQREWERDLHAKVTEMREFAAFGEGCSRLVHDLRRSGHALELTLRNVRTHFSNPAFREDAIRTLESAAGRIRHLIDDLCVSPTRTAPRLELTTLGTLVRSALDLLAESFRERPRVEAEIRGLDRALECVVDVKEMQRVVADLLLNAHEGAAQDGKVIVRGYQTRPRNLVHLAIENTGPAIPMSYLQHRLFRPFQSLKAHGLGLGLYHAKNVVQAHGGSLEVRNREDRRGVRVTLTLPGADGGSYVAAEHSPRRG